MFNLIDERAKGRPAIRIGRKLRSTCVIEVLSDLFILRGAPDHVGSDNVPEFAGRLLDQWAYLNKVELALSGPRKPSDSTYIEAINSRLRQECLNASWFLSLGDARALIYEWRIDYNRNRPHSALGGMTPTEFADQPKPARKVA